MQKDEFIIEVLSIVQNATLLHVIDTIRGFEFEIEYFGHCSGIAEQTVGKTNTSEQYAIRLITTLSELMEEEEDGPDIPTRGED